MTCRHRRGLAWSCLLAGCGVLGPSGNESTAGLRLTIETRGLATDKSYFVPDGYRITVDGEHIEWQALSGTGATTVMTPEGAFLVVLPTGSHELELVGVPPLCQVEGPNPWVIEVFEGAATQEINGVRWVERNDFEKAIDCAFVLRGQEIAFSGADRFGGVAIFLMGEDGSEVVGLDLAALLPPAERAWQGPTAPDWSPDGSQIVFSHPSTGGGRRTPEADIYVLDLSSAATVTRLTQSGGSEPVWSPDGTRIAFSSYRGGDWEVYVMDSDGSGPINITNNPARDVEPTWAPDGGRIAFTSHRDGVAEPGLEVTTNSEVYVMDADGSNPVNLTHSDAQGADRDDHPSWSPDGSLIAFISGRDVIPPHNWALYVMEPDGSNPVNLANDQFVIARPAWSPTGTRIVVVSGESTLDIRDIDGSNLVRLTTGLHPGTDPGELGRVNAPSWRSVN